MNLKSLQDASYFKLNSGINRPTDDQIPLNKDKEALAAFFEENVKPNTMTFPSIMGKINHLIEQEYIEAEFIQLYPPSFVEELYQFLDERHFFFKLFMAAYKSYSRYTLKTNDDPAYLETYEDWIVFDALCFVNRDGELAPTSADEMIHRRYQPATPSFLNAGCKRWDELVSCLLTRVTDGINSIGRSIDPALQLSRIGSGVGVTLSDLREAGVPIRGHEGAVNGVVPVMKLFEDSLNYSNQLGQRQGAGAIYLSVSHPDIITPPSVKKGNADEKIRVKTLSLDAIVPDEFYELIRKNGNMYLLSPYSVEKEYGVPFSYIDITAKYDRPVANPNIRKRKIKACDPEDGASELQQEFDYPRVINIDTMNHENLIDGKIIMSNLYSEILQVQTSSVISDKQEYEVLGTDISYGLGSTNTMNLMQNPSFDRSMHTMIRVLTFITDASDTDVVPPIQNGNKLNHTIRLGVVGLHTYLVKEQMEYGSEDSLDFTNIYFMLLGYWTPAESNNITREGEQVLHSFEESAYADGTYSEKYVTGEFQSKSEEVKALFEGIFTPAVESWNTLEQAVMENGLYHQNRLAVTPSDPVLYISDTNVSIRPITRIIEEHREKKIGRIYYLVPYLSSETIPYYAPAYGMDMRKVIGAYTVAQQHVGRGMGLTLFMCPEIPEGIYEWRTAMKRTTCDLNILRHYIFHKRTKSIYYVHIFVDDVEEIGSD